MPGTQGTRSGAQGTRSGAQGTRSGAQGLAIASAYRSTYKCCPWPPAHEKVAQELIAEQAKKTAVGRCLANCDPSFFARLCVRTIYIISFLLVVFTILFISLIVEPLDHVVKSQNFKSTTCTAVAATYTGEVRTCKKDCERGCERSYDCVEVKVVYPQVSSAQYLFFDYSNSGRGGNCFYSNGDCYDSDPNTLIKSLVQKVNSSDPTFPCLFNEDATNQVVYSSYEFTAAWQSAVACCLLVLALLFASCCYVCRCKYIWSSDPTSDVEAIVEQQKQERRNKSETNLAFGKS